MRKITKEKIMQKFNEEKVFNVQKDIEKRRAITIYRCINEKGKDAGVSEETRKIAAKILIEQ